MSYKRYDGRTPAMNLPDFETKPEGGILRSHPSDEKQITCRDVGILGDLIDRDW